jgi:magnesium transporter
MTESPSTELQRHLTDSDAEGARALLAELGEADRLHLVSRLSTSNLTSLLHLIGAEAAAELVEDLPASQAADAIEGVEPGAAAEILEELSSDDRVDVLAAVEAADREAILDAAEPDTATEARALLEFAADTAGGLMHTEFLSVAANLTVADALREIQRSGDEYAGYSVQYLYATDGRGRLAGVVPMRAMLFALPDTPIANVMIREPVMLKAEDTLDVLYELFQEHGFVGAPVVDERGVMRGVVDRSDVDDATIDSAEADHMKSLGIASGEELRSMPIFDRARRRLAWLSINIVLNLMAASVIAMYEETLTAVIALAVFLPIISDMSGCSGNQAVAVSLREISLNVVRPTDLLRVLWKEAFVGVVNGLALGALLASVAWLWKGSPLLGAVVGAALALNTLLAVSIGGTVPLVIKHMGWDPALASGPILTTLTDVCGFFLTLSFAAYVLT